MRLLKNSILVFVLLSGVNSFSQVTQVSQWRGINRDGIYNEKNLLKSWPANGPSLLWFNENIGDGYGSPVIANNTLYVNGETDSVSQVFAFDLSGKLLWKTPNGKEFTGSDFSSKFAGSRSTPTVVGNLIYACSGNGRISCIDATTGAEKWAVDLQTEFKGEMGYFGYAESILVDGDMLFCFPGNKEKEAAALNRFTGKTIWVSKALGDTLSYCSPMIVNLPNRKVLLNFTAFTLIAFDAATGEFLWSQKQENVVYKQQCNTPIFSNGYLYYLAGDGNGAVKLELTDNGKSYKEIWRNKEIKNTFYGYVKLGDKIYATDRSQKLKCLDTNTGSIIDTIKVSKGSIIEADNKLLVYSDNGEVNLIQLNGSKMELVSKFKIEKGTKEHFAHPVINNGVLYIRHGKSLLAYDIKEK